MKRWSVIFFLFITGSAAAQLEYSRQMAAAVMQKWKDSSSLPRAWTYETGLVLKGMEGLWYLTGDKKYFDYMQQCMDHYMQEDGTIKTYKAGATIDNLLCGSILLTLFFVTEKQSYYKAARLLRTQLQDPNQVLGDLYMAAPFYAQWAAVLEEDTALHDVAARFISMEQYVRDATTGIFYHGWDESRQQSGSDNKTGRWPDIWQSTMGWYGMALVDALDYFPAGNNDTDTLIALLNRYVAAIAKEQDPATGLWWDRMDSAGDKDYYTAADASSMFVYTIAKAVRAGYIPATYKTVAEKGYQGMTQTFVQKAGGEMSLTGTISASGLNNIQTNDPKNIGGVLLASNEMERLHKCDTAKGAMVLLDSYFNNESRTLVDSIKKPWHYKWNEYDNGGFSLLGYLFNTYGAVTATCHVPPTTRLLSKASVYIIVDPDIPKENPAPNYISEGDVQNIYEWVNNGGVLMLMGNDTGNAEFDHFNMLAARFGITFNKDRQNRVEGTQFEMGAINIDPANEILHTAKKIYIKEFASLAVTAPAKKILIHNGQTVIAVAKQGKGAVFAIGDPWLYNEYTDGRRLPATFQNYQAADDLVLWLLQQVPVK